MELERKRKEEETERNRQEQERQRSLEADRRKQEEERRRQEEERKRREDEERRRREEEANKIKEAEERRRWEDEEQKKFELEEKHRREEEERRWREEEARRQREEETRRRESAERSARDEVERKQQEAERKRQEQLVAEAERIGLQMLETQTLSPVRKAPMLPPQSARKAPEVPAQPQKGDKDKDKKKKTLSFFKAKAPPQLPTRNSQDVYGSSPEKTPASPVTAKARALPRVPQSGATATSSADPTAALTDIPDPTKVRQWTDRTGGFKVYAQLVEITDGKAILHKTNGVKIAVPLSKLCDADIKIINQASPPAPLAMGTSSASLQQTRMQEEERLRQERLRQEKQRIDQILTDEDLARRLQQEEHAKVGVLTAVVPIAKIPSPSSTPTPGATRPNTVVSPAPASLSATASSSSFALPAVRPMQTSTTPIAPPISSFSSQGVAAPAHTQPLTTSASFSNVLGTPPTGTRRNRGDSSTEGSASQPNPNRLSQNISSSSTASWTATSFSTPGSTAAFPPSAPGGFSSSVPQPSAPPASQTSFASWSAPTHTSQPPQPQPQQPQAQQQPPQQQPPRAQASSAPASWASFPSDVDWGQAPTSQPQSSTFQSPGSFAQFPAQFPSQPSSQASWGSTTPAFSSQPQSQPEQQQQQQSSASKPWANASMSP